jgi:uncharacterized protein
MNPPSPLRFRLRELPAQRDIDLAEAFVREAVGAAPGQAEIAGDPGRLRVSVDVTLEHEAVFAHGRLAGDIAVSCSRCLTTIRHRIDEPLALTFLPHAERADAETDVELAEDDADVAVHDGNEVDLADALRDHIVLSVPYAPLCTQDCKGLCPRCGADLNEGACDCPPVEAESRFAALKNLKLS